LVWFLSAGIKQRMEKDVDEVGKIARSIKSKLEELDKEVGQLLLLFSYRFTAF